MPNRLKWRTWMVLLGALILLGVIVTGCGGKKAPTPVPTLPNVTVIPLTPTAPAVPKYLPTRPPTRVPTQAAAPQPTPTPKKEQSPEYKVVTVETIGATPTVAQPRVEVVVSQAHAYNGPGEQFIPVGVATAGQQLLVEERSSDGQWLHVCCFAGRPGWVALKNVRPLTDLDSVPVATAVPQVSPLPTPTPSQ